MAVSLEQAGFEVWDVTMQDLLNNDITLDRFKGVIFPGGFSYAGKISCIQINNKNIYMYSFNNENYLQTF